MDVYFNIFKYIKFLFNMLISVYFKG